MKEVKFVLSGLYYLRYEGIKHFKLLANFTQVEGLFRNYFKGLTIFFFKPCINTSRTRFSHRITLCRALIFPLTRYSKPFVCLFYLLFYLPRLYIICNNFLCLAQFCQLDQHLCQVEQRMLLLLLSHFSRVRLSATPWTVAYQAPPSMGFPRQEYWSGLPLPSPEQSICPEKSKRESNNKGF